MPSTAFARAGEEVICRVEKIDRGITKEGIYIYIYETVSLKKIDDSFVENNYRILAR